MRTKLVLVLLLAMSLSFKSSRALPSSGSTSTEWRNDEANLEVVREFNRALEHIPFSSEHEGVLDQCPFRIDWSRVRTFRCRGKGESPESSAAKSF